MEPQRRPDREAELPVLPHIPVLKPTLPPLPKLQLYDSESEDSLPDTICDSILVNLILIQDGASTSTTEIPSLAE